MAGTITPSRSARNSPQPAWIACLLVRKSRAEQDWHPALRSLECRLRFAIVASLGVIRRLSGMGSPSLSSGS
jgi:hypothetical protein